MAKFSNKKEIGKRVCPDCGKEIFWNENYGMFTHEDNICAYMEDIFGKRIWGNKERDDASKNIEKDF